MHWKRWRRNGDPSALQSERPRSPVEDRFWSKVDRTPGPHNCWLWTASKDELGYGYFRVSNDQNMSKAHRVSWILTHGEIPPSMFVCHICDTPSCCNPKHLYLGTHQENMRDKMIRQRSTKGRPVHHGELSFHKLELVEVNEIRERYARGGVSQSALATEFGVSQTHVGRIVRGERWQHDPA